MVNVRNLGGLPGPSPRRLREPPIPIGLKESPEPAWRCHVTPAEHMGPGDRFRAESAVSDITKTTPTSLPRASPAATLLIYPYSGI